MRPKKAPDPPVADQRYVMAYQEALRSISQQQQVLNELRARTGTLVVVATIATSFLGVEAFTGERSSGFWAWLAVGAFGATCVCAISVLWPRRNWLLGCFASTLIEGWIERDNAPSLDEIHRQRALYLEQNYEANRVKLNLLFNLFSATSVLLVSKPSSGSLICGGGEDGQT